MTPSEAATIAAVAGIVRRKILSGGYPDGKVASRMDLSREHGISPESAGVVLRMMRDEGLVTLRQGAGTFVADLRSYRVVVSIERSPAAQAELRRQARQVLAAERASPAVADLNLSTTATGWEWQMTVRSSDPGRAALAAVAAVSLAAGAAADLSAASVSITPAAE